MQRSSFGPISRVALDRTGRWVAAAAPISAILWAQTSGAQLSYLRGHKKRLTDIAFSPRRPTLLTASRDGTVRTYTCQLCIDLLQLVHVAEVRLARTH
jgi:WD40 repeat protein